MKPFQSFVDLGSKSLDLTDIPGYIDTFLAQIDVSARAMMGPNHLLVVLRKINRVIYERLSGK